MVFSSERTQTNTVNDTATENTQTFGAELTELTNIFVYCRKSTAKLVHRTFGISVGIHFYFYIYIALISLQV